MDNVGFDDDGDVDIRGGSNGGGTDDDGYEGSDVADGDDGNYCGGADYGVDVGCDGD